MDRSYALSAFAAHFTRICTTIVVTTTKAMSLNDEALTMSAARMYPQTIAQALGHQTACMVGKRRSPDFLGYSPNEILS